MTKKRIISVFYIIVAIVLFAFMFLPSVVDQESEASASKFEFLRYAFDTDFDGFYFWEHAYVWGTIMQILSIVFLIIVSFLSISDKIKLKTLLKLACLHWCAVSVLFLAYINSVGSLWSIGSILSILVDIMEIAVAGWFLRLEKKNGKNKEKKEIKPITDTKIAGKELVSSQTIILQHIPTGAYFYEINTNGSIVSKLNIGLAKRFLSRKEALSTLSGTPAYRDCNWRCLSLKRENEAIDDFIEKE